MPVQATVILDSGCILPGDENSISTDIGYFQSAASAPDIRVVADGRVYPEASLQSLGQNCVIEVRHVKSDGSINRSGARATDDFHNEILHLRDLYGVDIPVSSKNYECVLRFDAGLFCAAQVKPRQFKVYRQQSDGQYLYSPSDALISTNRPIAHNIHVLFRLDDGDLIELARDGAVFWSSSRINVAHRLEIEVIADNSTADKFYRDALTGLGDRCYLPNQGDPPPVCPEFPCRPPSGGIL
ncbi:MAG: hypothetical protein ACJ74J_13900 [Blastocatellia bacterium]